VTSPRSHALTDVTVVCQRPRQLASAYLNDEVMLLSIERGRYYNLNRVGSHIWKLIESPRAIGDICRTLEDAFDVPPQVCRDDVIELVSRLVDEGLAVIVTT
jgi:coenzyme PQQ synthesis protein D (PqqD)